MAFGVSIEISLLIFHFFSLQFADVIFSGLVAESNKCLDVWIAHFIIDL